MSLVETDILPNLNLRVFKRSGKFLVLLWNRIPGTDQVRALISAKSLDSNQKIDVTDFVIDPAKRDDVSENLQVDPNMVVCVIQEAKNGLDEKQNYYVTVSYEGTDIRQSIRVTRAGVLPDHERENRDQNSHMFLWDPKNQNWRKWSGVMVSGKFYAGVVTMPCPSCGFNSNEAQT